MSKTHTTKPWITTLFVLSLLIILIITWVLVGEFNVLHQQWLIAYRGTLWSGKITDRNLDWLNDKFGKYMNNLISNSQIGDSGKIISNTLIFNPLILIPLFSCLFLAIIVPVIFKATYTMNIDVLPYSVSAIFSMLILIFSGLIPHWKNASIWLWIIRFVILLCCVISSFLTINKIINKFLINTNYANAIVNEFNQIENEKKPYRSSLTNLRNQVDKKDSMKYVEEA